MTPSSLMIEVLIWIGWLCFIVVFFFVCAELSDRCLHVCDKGCVCVCRFFSLIVFNLIEWLCLFMAGCILHDINNIMKCTYITAIYTMPKRKNQVMLQRFRRIKTTNIHVQIVHSVNKGFQVAFKDILNQNLCT